MHNKKIHLFITGEKHSGKSTLLKSLLDGETRRIGGFYTVRAAIDPAHPSVHMLRAWEKETPSQENLLFYCGEPAGKETARRFNGIGCRILDESREAELIIMDELGPKESNALEFQAAILCALNGKVPILGVLQKAQSAFLDEILNHPSVQIKSVAANNYRKY